MFWVTRKLTEKVVGRNVPEDSIDTYLSCLPAGVYAIEDSDGNELNEVKVRAGRVEYAKCYGPKPVVATEAGTAVVAFATV
jgi:hypothetical protein